MTSINGIFQEVLPESGTQLAQQLRRSMIEGRLKEGDQLPTIRELVSETGLSYGVVNRVFGVLQSEGLLVCRKRGGTIVAGRSDADAGVTLRVFGLICPELSTGFYPALQTGFDLSAGRRGYQIIACNTDNDYRLQADAMQQLMQKRVAGVALVPATVGPSPAGVIAELQRNGVHVVLLHRGVEGASAPLITIPGEKVGRLAGQQLLQAGHTQIAYCGTHRSGLANAYESGLRAVLEEAGVGLDARWIDYGNMERFDPRHYASYEDHLQRWFDQHMRGTDRPTAVFCGFESSAEIAYLVAMRHGFRIPEDLSIVAVGGICRQGAIVRRLTCVTINERVTGEMAVQLLDSMCQERRPLDTNETLSVELRFDPGETLAEVGRGS